MRAVGPVRVVLAFGVLLIAAGCGGSGGEPGADPGGPEVADAAVDPGAPAADEGLDGGRDAATDPGPGPDTGEGDAIADAPGEAGDDAGTADAPVPGDAADADGAEPADAAADVPPDCPGAGIFDYVCSASDPTSCPGGICVLGQCVAPVLDPDRWDGCGDGPCAPCETAEGCPADCGATPPPQPQKAYDDPDTITVWVHGFSNKSNEEMATMVFGRDRGCGGLLEMIGAYGVDRPCLDAPGNTAGQMTAVEYYGGTPAPWLTAAQIAEIEQHPYDGPTAIDRYALIVAKFIRWKLVGTGARLVNLACHSMGCYVLRHVIENNVEGLAGEGRFVRWFTSAGVIAGAQLARLYDNPTVRDAGGLIGFELNDFVIMHPDHVQDHTAAWDHRLQEGNSPYLAGTLIHHMGGTDPKIREALNIALLDLNNPGDRPNDGIMFTEDEYFHAQGPLAVARTPSGTPVPSTLTLVREYHMQVPETEASAVMAAAALFHRRKAVVRVQEVLLKKDRETHSLFDGENGQPPAEVVVESAVRFDPYVRDTFGRDVLVHEDRRDHRAALSWKQTEGQVAYPAAPVFSGPVFDAMQTLRVKLSLLEADWYPRWGVTEWSFDADEALASWEGDVPLQDGTFEFESEFARVKVSVQVFSMY